MTDNPEFGTPRWPTVNANGMKKGLNEHNNVLADLMCAMLKMI